MVVVMTNSEVWGNTKTLQFASVGRDNQKIDYEHIKH